MGDLDGSAAGRIRKRFDHDERSEVGGALGFEGSAALEPVDEVLLGGEDAIAGKTTAVVAVVVRPLGLTQPLHRQGTVQVSRILPPSASTRNSPKV